MQNMKGRTAVVTGAAMGMGREISRRLLEEGCRVILADMNEIVLKETEAELSRIGDCHAVTCDITNSESVALLLGETEDVFSPATLLVNNAGIVKAAPLTETDDEDVRKIIDVNLTALFRTTRAFIPGMEESGGGHIVNMASAGGILAIPNLTAYAASKFGVIGFSDALRQEMKKAGNGIGVTYVCPNTVKTGMFEGSKMVKGTAMLSPEIVAKAVVRAVRRNRPFCGVPWFSLRVVTPLMKTLLTINTMDRVCRLLGMWSVNDSWTGRND